MKREYKFRIPIFDFSSKNFLYFLHCEIGSGWYFNDFPKTISNNIIWGDIQQNLGIKDKNGKEIYDGDILENRKFGGKFYILWGIPEESYLGWCIKWIKKNSCNNVDYALVYNSNLENCEIIGNIYENPELL